MATITKEFTILAVHGDVNEANVQAIMNEKNARDPRINPFGVMPGNPAVNTQGIPHDTSTWPKAACNGGIVAEDGAESRVEISVRDFVQIAGVVQGGKIRVTIEVVA